MPASNSPETLFENALVGMFRTSIKEKKVLAVNDTGFRLFGYPSKEQFLKEFDTEKHYANPKDREQLLRTLSTEGEIHGCTIEFLRRDGAHFWAEFSARISPERDELEGVVIDITIRKKIEEALQTSEERFRQIFENQPEYCYLISPDEFILDVNDAALNVLGYKKKELVGKRIKKIYAPESIQKMKQLFVKWKKTGKLQNEEMVIISKGGSKHTVLLSAVTVKDKDGKVLHSISLLRDITDRKQAEEKNRDYTQQLQAIHDASHTLVTSLDFKNVITKCTTLAKELMDADGVVIYLLNPEETFLKPIIAHAPHKEKIMSMPLKLGEGVTGEVALSGKAEIVNRVDLSERGKQIPGTPLEAESLLSAPLKIHEETIGVMTLNRLGDREFLPNDLTLFENLVNISAAAIDNARLYEQAQKEIGERRKAQEALRESEALFRGIFSAMQNGYYRLSKTETILLANPAMAEMLEYASENDLIGKNIYDLGFVDTESRRQIHQEISKKREVTLVESEWTTSTGSVIHVIETIRAVQANGKLLYYEGTVQNVTRLKKLEAQLLQTQKLEVIGTLGGRIAHEINNRLTSVLGYADLCLLKIDKDSKLHKYIKSMQDNTRNAAGITRQLLNISKKQPSKPRDFEPDDLIQSLNEILNQALGSTIAVKIKLNSNHATIHADPTLIEQVIMNLILNARDAMPEEGELLIETFIQKVDDQFKLDSAIPHGSYLLLKISDTGTGMAPEVIEKMFEPFFTTKDETIATGLGLPIVQQIVKDNGGYISVNSKEGTGTTFNILFPLTISQKGV